MRGLSVCQGLFQESGGRVSTVFGAEEGIEQNCNSRANEGRAGLMVVSSSALEDNTSLS